MPPKCAEYVGILKVLDFHFNIEMAALLFCSLAKVHAQRKFAHTNPASPRRFDFNNKFLVCLHGEYQIEY